MEPFIGAAFLIIAQASDPVERNLDMPPQVSAESERPATDDAELEPDVTIINRGEEGTIEEYRVNGALYMVKVVPVKGAPYYLIDSDGDGNLETRRDNLDPDVVIPRWTLFRWK